MVPILITYGQMQPPNNICLDVLKHIGLITNQYYLHSNYVWQYYHIS